jgi:hypothetical protein
MKIGSTVLQLFHAFRLTDVRRTDGQTKVFYAVLGDASSPEWHIHSIWYPSGWHDWTRKRRTRKNPKVHHRTHNSPTRLCVEIRNKYWVLRGGLLALRPTPRLEDHPLSAVRDCLFNIFAATLHIWRPSPLSATWGRAMPWRQWTHLTWFIWVTLLDF